MHEYNSHKQLTLTRYHIAIQLKSNIIGHLITTDHQKMHSNILIKKDPQKWLRFKSTFNTITLYHVFLYKLLWFKVDISAKVIILLHFKYINFEEHSNDRKKCRYLYNKINTNNKIHPSHSLLTLTTLGQRRVYSRAPESKKKANCNYKSQRTKILILHIIV